MAVDRRRRGRYAEAERNDVRILEAARDVFVANPSAPVSEVASRAGVGIAALYHRYPSKDALLGKLCLDGQDVYLEAVQAALDSAQPPWEAYVTFLRTIVEANTHALTSQLAGTFTPGPEHAHRSDRMQALTTELFERVRASGALREGLEFLDVAFLLELLSRPLVSNPDRAAELRQRLLSVIIDGLRSVNADPLPYGPPTWQEQVSRWLPS
jgi:AcrR family transcriptional regulator